MPGTEYNPTRAGDGCPATNDGFNCKLSHSLHVRISTLETTVRNAIGTYNPLIPLSDRIRENISMVAEMAHHSKHHVNSLLGRVQKLEDNNNQLSINFSTIRQHVVSASKNHKFQSETVNKLVAEHQEIMKSLQNEEVCRKLSSADLENVKKDRDELYDKQEELEKELREVSTKFAIESSTRAAQEATTRRIFAVAGAIVTFICTIISVVVPFLVKG